MTVLADKKAERGGPGPKGRQPKWAMPASEAWYAALKKSFFMVHTLRRLLFVTLAIGVYSFGQAQETLAYSFGPQEMLSLSGEGNSSHYTTFSVVEPITGLSTSDDNRTEVYAGFLGAVGGSNAQPSILAISSLAVHENKPVGTLVGELNASYFESESVTFTLVQGEGSADNEHFSLSTNGLLTTRGVFDYEQGVSEFTIRARASGTGEEWAEKVFLIYLIDVNEDQDGDGILDDQDPDDDNDGYSDTYEIAIGSDPRNAASTPLNYGLVAWYPFDGNASDMSGNGNHGTVNGATLGADRHGVAGKAYSFDGVDDKIKIPHSVLNSKTELTVSFWYKMDSLATTFQHFLSGANSSHDNRFLLELRPTQPCFLLRDELTSVNAKLAYYGFSGYPFFRSRWVNLVLSRDLLGASLYSYGSLKHRSDYITNSLSIDQDGLWIGADQDSVGGGWVRDQHLHGFLDDFRIYDRALSAVEIGLLYDTETELPTGAVTSAKLSPELSDLIDGNGSIEQALPAGSVIARKPGEAPPPGYIIFQRNEHNTTLVWEERAPISMARYAFDGADVIDGKIYFTGMKNDTNRTGSKLLERYDPATDTWETLADRPKVRYAPCTTVLDGKYYVMGGDQRAVEIYDPQTNSWSEGVAMPIDVDHCGAVTFEGKIYVMGENQAIVFDPSTNEWTLKSQSNFTTYGTALAIYEERIWSFTEDGVESYDPRTDTWQVEKSLAVNRQFATAWIYDNQLYVACGRVWKSDDKSRFNLIDRYDSKNQKWVEVGHFPGERAVMDSALIGNRVYIVGGAKPSLNLASMYSAELPLLPEMNLYFKEGNATTEVELSTLGMADGSVTLGQLAPDALAKIGLDHNPATAEGSLLAVPRGSQPPPGYAIYKRSDRNGSLVWEEKAPISLAGHVYDGLEVLNGEVYLHSRGAGFEKYMESNNSWKSLTPSPNARSALASASLSSKLYLMGGEGPIVAKVDFYDSQTKEWQVGPSLPIAVRAGQALTVEDTIYFIGGSVIDENSSARVFSLTEGANHWIERASMPTPRRGHKLVYFKNRIWSLGGWSEGIGNLQTVESYDPKTDTWRTEPSMVETRHWPVTWSNGAKLFVGGGANHGSTLFKATIEAYDPDRGEWELVDNLPYKSYVSDAIVHDGEVYFVGGNVAAGDHSDKFYTADITPPIDLYYREANASGTITLEKLSTDLAGEFASSSAVSAPVGLVTAVDYNDDAPSDHTILERTDRNATHQWKEMAPVAQSKYAHDGVTVLDGKLYFVGGRKKPNPLSYVESFDLEINEWTELSPLPVERQSITTVGHGGKLYTIGGNDGDVALSTTVVFNPPQNLWTSGPALPEVLQSSTSVSFNNNVFLFGGDNRAGSYSNKVYYLEEGTESWQSAPDMPTARSNAKALVVQDKIWVIGGSNENGVLSNVEIYNPSTLSWSIGVPLEIPKSGPAVWFYQDRVYVAGGTKGPNDFTNSVEIFDLKQHAWISLGTIPEEVSSLGFGVLDQRIVLAGGHKASGGTNKVYAADLLPHRDLYFRSVASETVNRKPSSILALGDLNISENQPASTIVGEFNATDPEGGVVTCSLVSGEGDTHNSLFVLDEFTGVLSTNEPLISDIHGPYLSIRIRAFDVLGAWMDGVFTIQLIEEEVMEPPRDFSLSNNRILENRPVGTLVGTFYVPLEDTFDFEYFLVSGSGDTGNQYFKLSSDGKLTTFVQFDYESKRGTTVRVSIQNKKGEAVEKVFQLIVENDAARAIVRTIPPKFLGRTLKVAGQLEDAGEISSEEKVKLGILVSNRPIRGGTSDKRAKRFDLYEGPLMLGAFGTNYSMPQGWRKAYVVAFAETFEGTSYGLLEVFEVPVKRSVDSWIGATALTASKGWWESPWLGTFYKSEESGWVLHLGLGWVYPSPAKMEGVWMWKESLGWLWTKPALYPFLYRNRTGGWSYFYGEYQKNRLLFDYTINDWILLDNMQINENQNAR